MRVDAAAIPNDPLLIKHENLRSPSRTELIGDTIADVLQDRKRDVVAASVCRDFRQGVLNVGINPHKRNACLA